MTGKTFRGVRWIVDQVLRGADPRGIAFVSYTVSACDEARRRVLAGLAEQAGIDLYEGEIEYCATLHALCKRALGLSGKWNAEERLAEFGDSYGYSLQRARRATSSEDMEDLEAAGGGEDAALLEVWNWSRNRLIRDADAAYQAFADYEPDAAMRIGYPRFLEFVADYEGWKRAAFCRDYADLLLDVLDCPRALPVAVVAIDEAQDMTPLLWAAADVLFAEAQAICYLGDDDQCQPPGTSVLTTKGPIPIEELSPEEHRLVSYDRTIGTLCGMRHGLAFEKGCRTYTGLLYTVSAGRRSSECTPEHRWLVRWTETAKRPETCVVYLMRQGGRFRVGWCQLFRTDGIFHVGVRARLEKADAAWILRVFTNRSEASVYESIVAARFGLPTITFEPPTGAIHQTRACIDQVFDALAEDTPARVNACLDAHRQQLSHPIYTPEGAYARRGGTSLMVLPTCCLISGLMALPVQECGAKISWQPIRLAIRDYSGPVYSLDVERTQLYVADGMVTHNSIYSFIGAAPELLNSRPAARVVKLEQSHRLPARVAALAARIIGRNRDR
ncbi:MAG: AAA family ATPase, partial [Candidatus Levybacteria bacterium]|nr:AAA family ATPase [Candidatus Levybacteria bacterium]